MLGFGLVAMAAALTVQNQDYAAGFREASCVESEQTQNRATPQAALEICTKRYGWNAAEARSAVAVGEAFGRFMRRRAAARAAGLDLAVIDEAFGSLTRSEIDAFADTGNANPLSPRILSIFDAKITDPGLRREAQGLLIEQIRTMNMMSDFVDKRHARTGQ